MNNSPSPELPSQVLSNFITVENIRLHYLEAGKTENVILMLHGFPTAAYLWRNIMHEVSKTHRVIALDLPGYGKSDKPLSVSYSSNFFTKILSAFLDQLNIKSINLAVHDLGGPIGIHWAVRNPKKIRSLIFLNTLVYPNFSWAVVAFTLALKIPFLKNWIASPNGIAWGLKLGVKNKNRITGELLSNYQTPFIEKKAQQALLKSASNISLKAFKEIEEKLPLFKIPAIAIYGVNDKILPNVGKTMIQLKKDLPQLEINPIPNCGHFLQEDEPALISQLLVNFFSSKS